MKVISGGQMWEQGGFYEEDEAGDYFGHERGNSI
ncbi:hypothetical protein ABID23_000964 [Bartonella silvatica]|uniref:Uncharacterized protein n=1 Tax=Bartonella silvatica TaxID=357760 RepID=A0ABV2HH46_9HYPH